MRRTEDQQIVTGMSMMTRAGRIPLQNCSGVSSLSDCVVSPSQQFEIHPPLANNTGAFFGPTTSRAVDDGFIAQSTSGQSSTGRAAIVPPSLGSKPKEFVMRHTRFILAFLISVAIIGAALFLSSVMTGCTNAQLASADAAIGGTPLTAVAVAPKTSSTQPATTQPTSWQLFIHLAQDAVTAAQPAVADAPAPVAQTGGIILLAIGGILSLFGVKQAASASTTTATANATATTATTKLGEIEDLIGAAAPSLQTAITLLVSNPTIKADLSSLLALASHPAAVAAAGPVTNVTVTPATAT
jgi:hypothetical protein